MNLVGKPDFVWPMQKVVLFVDGCFWHGHGCKRNLTPKVNVKRWQEKITNNRKRDQRFRNQLRFKGWKVVRVWECELSKKPEQCLERIRKAVQA